MKFNMKKGLIPNLLRTLGYKEYEVTCPGTVVPYTGERLEPHRTTIWARRQPENEIVLIVGFWLGHIIAQNTFYDSILGINLKLTESLI